ncbi:hypothetical protein BU16DRAFT_592578 [Lophium mytilinum]|uniref:DUF7580 domain-containing protein n=1 Tax=Lophium mytilinum TaxID=390894 RepID=A0A6A6QL46_9PEZI|nr:hypothetical protein BU16DRAFT_592578 [Lophium mytilinum]
MSGLEIVGVILGTLPLVVSAVEQYANGVYTTKRIFDYDKQAKRAFTRFRTEQAVCKNQLLQLLPSGSTGIVGIRSQSEGIEDLWKNPDIGHAIRTRLKGNYAIFVDMAQEVFGFMKAIMEILGVTLDKVLSGAESKMMKKIKFALKRGELRDLFEDLERTVRSLITLSKQALELETTAVFASKYRRPEFSVVRDCAEGVYSILQRGWEYDCRVPHTVSLRLEARTNDHSFDDDDDLRKSLKFRVIFSHTHGETPDEKSSWHWKETDVQLIDHDRSDKSEGEASSVLQEPISKKGSKKSVRFTPEAKEMIALQEPIFHPTMKPIQDLCKSIGNLQEENRTGCFGFLIDAEKKRRCSIYSLPAKGINQEPWSVVSLASMLRRITRSDRLNIAFIVASSVLQLYRTPWLDETWGKEDIWFMQRPGGQVDPAPFVSRQFSTPQGTRDDALRCTNVARNKLVRNPWLFALGVLLIELCYGMSIEDLGTSEDGGSEGGVASSEFFTALRIAQDDGIYTEAGERYGDAVRRCIHCDFDQRVTNLDAEEFRQAVYDRVIASLEADWKQFRAIA